MFCCQVDCEAEGEGLAVAGPGAKKLSSASTAAATVATPHQIRCACAVK